MGLSIEAAALGPQHVLEAGTGVKRWRPGDRPGPGEAKHGACQPIPRRYPLSSHQEIQHATTSTLQPTLQPPPPTLLHPSVVVFQLSHETLAALAAFHLPLSQLPLQAAAHRLHLGQLLRKLVCLFDRRFFGTRIRAVAKASLGSEQASTLRLPSAAPPLLPPPLHSLPAQNAAEAGIQINRMECCSQYCCHQPCHG